MAPAGLVEAIPESRAESRVGAEAPTTVWGVPLSPVTMSGAIDRAEDMIDSGTPGYFVSANLNFAMIHDRDPALRRVTREADLVLVDGMPLVWASRGKARPLPERVAGSDLIFSLCELAARRGFGVFLLGGAEGVVEGAAARLRDLYPGLRVAGTEAPPFGPMSRDDEEALLGRIRASGAEILIAAFSQPRGEFWMAQHHRSTGAAVNVQVGAAMDFAAGRVRRAPSWMRRCGLEWAFRLGLEPRRLALRYASNAAFLLGRAVAPPAGT